MSKIQPECLSNNKEWLRRQYVDLEKSTKTIAYELGLGTNTINSRLRKFNIPLRTQSHTKVMQLSGRRFGKFVVEERGENTAQGFARWWCKCDCGNRRLINQGSLVAGKRTQCKKCYCKSMHNNPDVIIHIYWKQILKGALYRDIHVDITQEEAQQLFIQQDKKCALSGEAIRFAKTARDHNHGETTASLDRKNSSLGYTINNVQWVHKDVNRLKITLDNDRFIELCQKIALHHSGNNQ